MALGAGLSFEVAGLGMTVLDLVGLGLSAVALVALAVRATRNLRTLADREPADVQAST